MGSRRSLAELMVGRVVVNTAQQGELTRLSLEDDSLLAVQTAPASGTLPIAATGTIQLVQQNGTTLQLGYENGFSQSIECAVESGLEGV